MYLHDWVEEVPANLHLKNAQIKKIKETDISKYMTKI